jgi:uncharacterized protein (TIRG00374 family)
VEQKNRGNKNSFNFKSLLILFLFVLGVYIVIPKLIGAEEALRLIAKVNKFYLFLALASEVASYCSAAWLLGIILSRLGYKIAFLDRFKIGSIAAFAIHFLPVASFGEGVVNYYFLKKKEVATGSILLMMILRIIITYAAFLGLFAIGLTLVPTYPNLSFSPKLVSWIIFLLIVLGVLYMVYLYRHKEKFRARWFRFSNLINFFLIKFKRKPLSQEKIKEVFEDIYQGIGLFGARKRTSFWAILAGILYWLGDIACLFFVFLSFGFSIHWGILIFGYGVATLAGLISFIPGGLGVTEGSLGLVYSGLGIPLSLTLMSILVFRFFSFWIWIPIGLISYLTLKRSINEDY